MLLAALVASAVLIVGSAMYSLAVKQIALSSIGRDSQIAFYASDTAAECALYWDNRYDYFDTTAPSDPKAADPTCDGVEMNASGRGSGPGGGYPQTMSFQIDLFKSFTSGKCVNVTILKTQNPITSIVSTTITADGYNTSCAMLNTSPNVLQRSTQIKR